MKKHIIALAGAFLLATQSVKAHCPLCTVGAAAAAGGAAALGVNNTAIGIFIGAFAISTGWWIARVIKRRYIPLQKTALITFSFLATIIPIKPLMPQAVPLYLSWIGTYGTTYAINLFLIGSLIGGIIVAIAPSLSKKITQIRKGKTIAFQGVMLTLSLLILAGVLLQLTI